ncbi:MAG: tyrosine-type recombinase/integrase [Candidatus Rokubacteria bacterium]|nr:tyrosine-type recombinase/integrase [Candidatus Rokubacteria bacterium]MBI3105488.1 tyrosine-type recombinase/integrase [Candidatus Rokubacteria bacterium]
MGAIFRPKYRDRNGQVRESAVWWIRFRQHGKTVRQSTDTEDERKARAFLREREGKVALNIPVSPTGDRLTLTDAATMLRNDYTANRRKSAATVEFRLLRLLAHFGATTRMSRLTTADVERYKAARLAEQAAPATINRELAALQRMASLAKAQHGLAAPFHVAKLEERNVRKGFFEPADFTAVCQHLRPELAGLARAAYLTGWRKAELRSRQWGHVDFAGGWLRLEPQETKNAEGRMFPLTPELRAVLEAQRARVESIQTKTARVVPWVFAGVGGGPVGDFKKAWATACIAAGLFRVEPVGEARDGEPPTTRKVPTRIFHDFRRSAVRNLIRAGIPETTAMALTGHLTASVFRRYAIVDEGMLRGAGAKLAAAAVLQQGKDTGRSGKVRAIRR